MIWIGTGGVPISSKERSTIGGIKELAKLGLNAMEVEFVRGVKMSEYVAKEVGQIAEAHKIRLSVHAPYYINLLSPERDLVKKSIERIIESMDRAEVMKADAVAVHMGFLGKLSQQESNELMKERVADVIEKMHKQGIHNVKLGPETMVKKGQWGSFEEVVQMYKHYKRYLTPYLDWGHMFAYYGGRINYAHILDEMEKLNLSHINSHFNCVKYSAASKSYVDIHQQIAAKTPDFKSLADELKKRKLNITLICETPALEKDALEMKRILGL